MGLIFLLKSMNELISVIFLSEGYSLGKNSEKLIMRVINFWCLFKKLALFFWLGAFF